MAIDVDALLSAVIGREGAFSNDAGDNGGATAFGITEATARANGYAGDMRAFPREVALGIYRRRYWIEPKFDRVAEIDPVTAERLLDLGVNVGPPTAAGFLQRALRALNQGGALYPDIRVDGSLGAASLGALSAFLAHRGADGRRMLPFLLSALAAVHYLEIAERDPTQERFDFGWILNRAMGAN